MPATAARIVPFTPAPRHAVEEERLPQWRPLTEEAPVSARVHSLGEVQIARASMREEPQKLGLDALPKERADLIRQRVREGYYNRPEVIQEIARRITQQLRSMEQDGF